MSFYYDPDQARPFLSIRCNRHLVDRLDEARVRLKTSRSDLIRRALGEMLDRMQIAEPTS